MTGRVALVTGAGRGIGRATATALATRGDRVMAVARTESDLRSLSTEVDAAFLVASVETPEECGRIVEETRRRLGPIEVLVNNAGISEPDESPIWDLDPGLWHRTLAVNLHGPFELTRLALPGMLERKWGRIVMVSSTAGLVGGPSMAAYVASKHALIGLMRAVAADVAPLGITCNAVAPGWVRTPMAEATAEAEAERSGTTVDKVWAERARSSPGGRVVEPGEVAATIAFLASAEAGAVNGETVRVALGSLW